MTIKFNIYNVTNGEHTARVHYSLDNRADGRKAVTIYEKDYRGNLGAIFSADEYLNETDTQTDYFDKGRVVLFADHPQYTAARSAAERWDAAWEARQAKRRAPLGVAQ